MQYPNNQKIREAFIKTQGVLSRYNNILVSTSGGSDSDIVLDMIIKSKQPNNNIHYVFFDTGIEYEATKRHLDFLENKYKIKIERIKPEINVPKAVKKFGIPFVNKEISSNIENLQKHNFPFTKETFDSTYEEMVDLFPKCTCALKWWYSEKNERGNITRNAWLREFMLTTPPSVPISSKCCYYAKKNVSKKYEKENKIDLKITGIRKGEGGIRAMAYKNCFSEKTKTKIAHFRPIFYFNREEKQIYEQFYDIVHSDCYTVYNMTRTGCAGCPFALDLEENLVALEKNEPKLFKAVNNIFKDAYDYKKQYLDFKNKMKKLYPSYKKYLEDNNIDN